MTNVFQRHMRYTWLDCIEYDGIINYPIDNNPLSDFLTMHSGQLWKILGLKTLEVDKLYYN